MSFGSCACPLPDSLTEIPQVDCGLSLKQVQKLLIGRRGAISFAAITGALSASTIAGWQALLDATDDTKVIVTPFVEDFKIPQGEAILEGGDDNTTIDGNPIVVGANSIRATGMFAELPPNVLSALKKLNCESQLEVALINQFGDIYALQPSGTLFKGIPITSFFVGDPGNEGLNTRDKAPVGFNFRYGWRDQLIKVTPVDFDARFGLIPS
jgi:hypothetical protein